MSEERWHDAARLRRLEEENEKLLLRLSALDGAYTKLRDALLKGPMTTDTGRGYRLIMTFESLYDVMEARRIIHHAVRRQES